jgi:BMFP domain-containing protein YqiC
MAEQRGQDLFSRLADRGEDVIGRITDMPGAQRLLETANQLKERVDEMQKKMRGLDALEQRVAALERKVDQLSTAGTTRRSAPRKTRTTRPSTGSKPKPASETGES